LAVRASAREVVTVGTRKRATFDAQNREAAGIILRDPARHGGEGAYVVQWARAVMARLGGTPPAPNRQGELFRVADEERTEVHR